MSRVVLIGFYMDRAGRSPEALLDAWPTLPGLASALARVGFDTAVVQPAGRAAVLRRDGVEYHFVEERAARLPRGGGGARAVRSPASASLAAVSRLSPSVIHVNGLGVPWHARDLKARLPDTPILAQDHANRPPPPWRRGLARKAMRAYDGVAFTAREQAAPFFRSGVFPPGLAVFEVPEGSTDFGVDDQRRARNDTGLHGDPCLLWLGHLNANKDPLTVLEGFATAAPHLPDPHLWCCYGQAPLLSRVRGRIDHDPVLARRVHLLGPRPHAEIEALLQAADALVQGSHREGSGYAVIEAMACGTTPVVTSIPSFRRLTGDVGLLWPPGDVDGLRTALLRLKARFDRDARGRVRRHFERHLSWDAVARQMGRVYDALTPAPTRPANRA